MMDDSQLLTRYVREHSQEAFAELVRRHLNFVYSAALRQVRSPQMAEDVSQLVFANLARKAASLSSRVVLAGWLHRDTRFTALDVLRAERRRRAREEEACSMNTSFAGSDPDWEQVRPWLDESLDKLNPAERDALLLRYFEQQSLAEIGTVLGASEDAARKRVARALDKLRALLARRGVTTTTSALALALTSNAMQTAPAALGGNVVASSLAASTAVGTGITVSNIVRTMTMSQVKTAILSVVAVAGITATVFEHLALEKLRVENRDLLARARQLAGLQAENERLSKAAGQAGLSSLADEQRAELLRLRGEVGRLRDNLRAAQASQSARTNQSLTETKSEAAPDASQPYTASFTARLRDGETIVTGGWSTAAGSHTFILLTPKIDPGDGGTTQVGDGANAVAISNAKVTVNALIVDIPDGMLAQFGLGQFTADGHESPIQNILSGTDAQALLDMLNNPPDGVSVSHPRITTSDGISAVSSIISDASSNYEQIGLTPNFTPDKTAVDLAINEQVVRPKP
jgi:RNA polymerase sigma factor (sigma-70 family)